MSQPKPSKLEELSKAVAEILGDFAQEVEQFGKTPELFGYAPRVSEPLDKIMPLITHAEEQAELKCLSERISDTYRIANAFGGKENKELRIYLKRKRETLRKSLAELDRINGGKDDC